MAKHDDTVDLDIQDIIDRKNARLTALEAALNATELERRVLCDALMVIESMHPEATADDMRKWAKQRRTESIVRLDAARKECGL